MFRQPEACFARLTRFFRLAENNFAPLFLYGIANPGLALGLLLVCTEFGLNLPGIYLRPLLARRLHYVVHVRWQLQVGD